LNSVATCCTASLPRQRIRYASRRYYKRHPAKFLMQWRKLGLEGVVGKRIGSIYEPGERSGAWIKLRANLEQEFVIGGYVPGTRGFDALLVGVYENKELNFVAKVKNGFVPRIRDEIFPSLKALQITQCLFKNLPEKRASRWGESLTAEKMDQCRWVKAKLVCQVQFVECTDAGHLRHCTFVAMRGDKKPAEVVRETDDRRPRSPAGCANLTAWQQRFT
jgi:ATP-dependent DNA ligase